MNGTFCGSQGKNDKMHQFGLVRLGMREHLYSYRAFPGVAAADQSQVQLHIVCLLAKEEKFVLLCNAKR